MANRAVTRPANRTARNTPGPHRHRQGYLLLAVLVCIVISGFALTSVAQQSFSLALEARQAQQNLQERWGALSCQRTLLPVAADVFAEMDELEKKQDTPSTARRRPSTVRQMVALGGLQFNLILADEDAKVNLNAVYRDGGRSQAEAIIRQMLGGARAIPVHLLPDPMALRRPGSMPSRKSLTGSRDESTEKEPSEERPADDEAAPPAFESWGQVFDLARAQSSAASWALPEMSEKLTCWGQGRLNIRRAPDDVVLSVCRPAISETVGRRLLKRYRENPDQAVALLIDQLVQGQEDQFQVKRLLTDQSSCYSLWITVSAPRPRGQRFAVIERVEEGVTRTSEFVLH